SSAESRSSSATRRSSCRTGGASPSSTSPATSDSSARWSLGRRASTSSCSSSTRPRARVRRRTSTSQSFGSSESRRGASAGARADAVDDETLGLALEEARELVPQAEAVAVSARTGAGLNDLRAALARAADGVTHEPEFAATRLYADRVFTLHGIGTVATGTLWAGSIAEGDELRVEPRGLTVRVRSVQVHDPPVPRAEAGQRVAVALTGVERTALRRGA